MDEVVVSTTGETATRKIIKAIPLINFPTWTKNLPYVGQAIAVLDLFMGGGKKLLNLNLCNLKQNCPLKQMEKFL